MHIFDHPEHLGHEQVVFCSEPKTGLKAIIAIHDTTLGPALGGCRIWPYANETEALKDVLRLSRGMTYKAAAAGLELGGGKAVILGDPNNIKNESLLRAFGRFVHSLGGRYITAEDVGSTVKDMDYIKLETPYVTGVSEHLGGSGNPSPITALGVLQGIKAAWKWQKGLNNLQGCHVAVQGVGHVGYHLTKLLLKEGAKISIADINAHNLQKIKEEFPQVQIVNPGEILSLPCDVLAPCAMGGVIHEKSLPELRCSIIAGSANNVLADEAKQGTDLQKKGIIYIPDFVISSGGLINVSIELGTYSRQRAIEQTEKIYDAILHILNTAEKLQLTPLRAAQELAEERIQKVNYIRKIHLSH